MKVINTPNAPAAIGPYEQAIMTDKFVFCSGQIGLEPSTGELAKGLEAQTNQILENIKAVLAKAGTDINHVVKTTIFITNMADFQQVNGIYSSVFSDHKPARSTVGVAALPKNALVEIEVIAEIS